MNHIKKFLTNNPCYQNNVKKRDSRYTTFQERGPLGFMLHSIGTPQPDAMVIINYWNRAEYDDACVHGFIDANDNFYQTMPFNYRAWHAGSAANNTHVGIEMTEPNTIKYIKGSQFTDSNPEKTKDHVLRTYKTAVEVFAMLCKSYNKDPMADGVILSHSEGHARGIASNHGDVEHLWNYCGLSMDQFRKDVKAAISSTDIKDLEDREDTYIEDEILKYEDIVVGETYRFIGSKHYASANAATGKSTYPSLIKITNKYLKSARHPIHARAIDERGNFISGVHGWVDLVSIRSLEEKPFLVKVTADALNIRRAPSPVYQIVGVIKDQGVYTIVKTQGDWGLLKSYADDENGWINLKYTRRV